MATKTPAPTAPAAQTATIEMTSDQLMSQLLKTDVAPEINDFVEQVFGGDKEAGGNALTAVLPWVMENAGKVSGRGRDKIEAMIAQIDQILTEQVNEILHASEFQKVEGSWRALQRLVMNSRISSDLKVRVLNVSKDELRETMREFPGSKWDQSPLFKKMYEERFGTLNGEPFGALIGDYAFSHASEDIEVMKGMGRIAMHCHAPFISSVAPQMLKIKTWRDVNTIADPAMLFDGDDYAVWRSFRKTDESKYVGLTMPRVLARRPYGAKGEKVTDFEFEEDVSSEDESKFVWSNASMVMGENINTSFYRHGWASEIAGIESGGVVKELPSYTFSTADGGEDMACPTEVGIPYAREYALSDLGFIPLCHAQGENWAAFLSAKSAHLPKEYMSAEDTKNSKLTTRLPYTFALSRFAHFLKKMVYMKINSPMPRKQVEIWLNKWINEYVLRNAENVSDYELLAARPLSAARVEVVEDEENPGMCKANFYLQPHFRLERIDISLRMVSRIPDVTPQA